MSLLFDSNILIQALNGTLSGPAEKLFSDQVILAISLVTRMEVLAGMRADTERATREFLDMCFVLPITPEIAEVAAGLRRTTRLKLPDAVIYATALETGRTLVTLNTRDFPPGTESVFTPAAD